MRQNVNVVKVAGIFFTLLLTGCANITAASNGLYKDNNEIESGIIFEMNERKDEKSNKNSEVSCSKPAAKGIQTEVKKSRVSEILVQED